jgi:hypothetical protein
MTMRWLLGWGAAGIIAAGALTVPLLILWPSPYAPLAAMAAGMLSPCAGWVAGAWWHERRR